MLKKIKALKLKYFILAFLFIAFVVLLFVNFGVVRQRNGNVFTNDRDVENFKHIEFEKNVSLTGEKFSNKIFQRDLNRKGFSQKYSINCFLYAYTKGISGITIKVYSTYKVDNCNPEIYKAATSASAKVQLRPVTDFQFVSLAGPHFQMMDENNTPVENPFFYIGKLKYTELAHGEISIAQLINENIHGAQDLIYKDIFIATHTDFLWYPDSKVFYIKNNNSEYYIMTHLTEAEYIRNESDLDLFASNLGSYMRLPPGWTYGYGKLNKLLLIKEIGKSGLSPRMSDEFGNIYFKIGSLNIR